MYIHTSALKNCTVELLTSLSFLFDWKSICPTAKKSCASVRCARQFCDCVLLVLQLLWLALGCLGIWQCHGKLSSMTNWNALHIASMYYLFDITGLKAPFFGCSCESARQRNAFGSIAFVSWLWWKIGDSLCALHTFISKKRKKKKIKKSSFILFHHRCCCRSVAFLCSNNLWLWIDFDKRCTHRHKSRERSEEKRTTRQPANQHQNEWTSW